MLQTDGDDFTATRRGFTVRGIRRGPRSSMPVWTGSSVKFDQRYLRPTEVDSLIEATRPRLPDCWAGGLRCTLTGWLGSWSTRT